MRLKGFLKKERFLLGQILKVPQVGHRNVIGVETVNILAMEIANKSGGSSVVEQFVTSSILVFPTHNFTILNFLTMFNFTVDPIRNQKTANFPAKVLTISKNVLELKNDNKTPYRVATIQFTSAEGELKTVTAIVYEKNFQYGMTEGETYQATVTITAGQASPLITVSHLAAGERATFDDFGVTAEVDTFAEANA